MVGVIMLVVIGLCIGGIVWRRRRRWQAYTTPVSPGVIPRETLVLNAFAHGNSCLAAGKFAEAIASFHQTRAPGLYARRKARSPYLLPLWF